MTEPELCEHHLLIKTIPSDAIISRNNVFVSMLFDDELACLDESTGNYFGLNATGRIIWELLESPLTLQVILDNLSLEFPENSADIQNEIPPFIAYLASLRIIEITVESIRECPENDERAGDIDFPDTR